MIMPSFGFDSGWVWGRAWGCTRKGVLWLVFVTYFGIVGRLMPAALDGAMGILHGVGCRV